MPVKPDAGSDFAAILNAAAQVPSSVENLGKDLPDGFPLSMGENHRMVETEGEGIMGMAAFDFKVHRKVFVIYRPPETCARCGNAMALGTVSLPDEGDYECPHVSQTDYEEVVNEMLAGKLIFGSEQEITQKDGSVAVSLRWYEKIPSKKKKPVVGIDGTAPEPSL